MRLLLRATDQSYRKAIADERNQGRLPLAWVTFGFVSGLGWGFLHPWAQIALFRHKGQVRGIGDTDRNHERFAIVRVFPRWAYKKHRNHDYEIGGRYWYGYCWRPTFGKWWNPISWQYVLLDPDIITHDPGKADDWGDRDGGDWG